MYKFLLSITLAFVLFGYSAYSNENKQSLDSLVRKGIELHKAGNYHAAIDLYKNAINQHPGESILHYELAVTYFAFGAYEKALVHVNRVKEPSGKLDKEAILLKSTILQTLYKYDQSESILKNAAKKYKDTGLFYYNLAHQYFKQEKDNQSILSLIESIKINPTYANTHFLMGRVFSKHIRKTESILAYYYFLLVEPNTPKSKISLKLIDNLIGLGVTKKNNDSLKADIYVSSDTTNIFAEADIMLSLMAANYEVSHFDSDTNDEILVAKMVAFFSILDKIRKENADSKNFMLSFYTKFFIDMHKAEHTETFCRYIRQSSSHASLDWLKNHPDEVKAFEDWLNSYYSSK